MTVQKDGQRISTVKHVVVQEVSSLHSYCSRGQRVAVAREVETPEGRWFDPCFLS